MDFVSKLAEKPSLSGGVELARHLYDFSFSRPAGLLQDGAQVSWLSSSLIGLSAGPHSPARRPTFGFAHYMVSAKMAPGSGRLRTSCSIS